MSHPRRILRLLTAAAVIAGSAIGITGAPLPAAAAPQGVADCFYGIGIYETHLGIPRKVILSGPVGPGQRLPDPDVVVNGNTDVASNTSCSVATVQYRLQTKVCGFWGCEWKTKANSNTTRLPVNGRVPVELWMGCRPGANSYRLQAAVTHVELTFEDVNGNWYPQLITVTTTHEGADEKITC